LFDLDVFLSALRSDYGLHLQPATSIAEFSTEDVVYSHSLLHKYFAKLEDMISYKHWTKPDVIYFHRLLTDEFVRRGIKHENTDSLDEFLE